MRKTEIKCFLDFMEEEDFTTKYLEFDPSVKIDLDKIVLGGHSMGGMTTIEASKDEKRIKAVFTFDPWLWCRLDEIRDHSYGIDQP